MAGMFGPLGQGTAVVDGQRVTLAPSAAFTPASYGPQTTGVPNVTPSIPPYLASNGVGAAGAGAGHANVDGYGTAENNTMVTQIAGDHPFSLKVSPVVWALGALVGGVLLLHFVSFREAVDNKGGKLDAEAKAEN